MWGVAPGRLCRLWHRHIPQQLEGVHGDLLSVLGSDIWITVAPAPISPLLPVGQLNESTLLVVLGLGHRLGPVLLWRNTIARQISRRKLFISRLQFSYYATSFLSTIVGTCMSSSLSER
jgi:hypothetical protein